MRTASRRSSCDAEAGSAEGQPCPVHRFVRITLTLFFLGVCT